MTFQDQICGCSRKTPYYATASLIVYVSGLLWLIYSLHLTTGTLHEGHANHTWPYDSPNWNPPFALSIFIVLSQILVGGITLIYYLPDQHVMAVMFEYVWILVALIVTLAPPLVIVIHFVSYNIAALLAIYDTVLTRTRVHAEEETRLNEEVPVQHKNPYVPTGQAVTGQAITGQAIV